MVRSNAEQALCLPVAFFRGLLWWVPPVAVRDDTPCRPFSAQLLGIEQQEVDAVHRLHVTLALVADEERRDSWRLCRAKALDQLRQLAAHLRVAHRWRAVACCIRLGIGVENRRA